MNPGRLSNFEIAVIVLVFITIWLVGPGCGGEEPPAEMPPVLQCAAPTDHYPCPLLTDHGYCGWFDGEQYNYVQVQCWNPDGFTCVKSCDGF